MFCFLIVIVAAGGPAVTLFITKGKTGDYQQNQRKESSSPSKRQSNKGTGGLPQEPPRGTFTACQIFLIPLSPSLQLRFVDNRFCDYYFITTAVTTIIY